MKPILIALLMTGFMFAAHAGEEKLMNAHYNQVIDYHEEQVLQYPDFMLRFVGLQDGGVLPNGVPLGTQHLFEAAHDSEIVSIAWGAGSGEIAPRRFTINGKKFTLERMFSTHASTADNPQGRLQENQLVIANGGS